MDRSWFYPQMTQMNADNAVLRLLSLEERDGTLMGFYPQMTQMAQINAFLRLLSAEEWGRPLIGLNRRWHR